ncbi:hypothetical protein T12_5238, partial [Trichinella patagoniensis]
MAFKQFSFKPCVAIVPEHQMCFYRSENPRWIMPPEALTRSSDVERWFIRMEKYFRAADVPDNRRAAM